VPSQTKRLNDVRFFDALLQALKAAVLAALLAFVWAMPASAHPGHGVSDKPTVQSASSSEHVVRQMSAAASLSSDDATVCAVTRPGMAAPSDDSQPGGGSSRVCCGTMCTVAAIELSVTSLAVRTSHRLRRLLPPDTLQLTRTPGLPPRPPRTSDIA
jgi:hypothetical protein